MPRDPPYSISPGEEMRRRRFGAVTTTAMADIAHTNRRNVVNNKNCSDSWCRLLHHQQSLSQGGSAVAVSGRPVPPPEVFEDKAVDGFDVGQETVSRAGENHRVRSGTPRGFRCCLRIVHLTRPGQCDEGRDRQVRQPVRQVGMNDRRGREVRGSVSEQIEVGLQMRRSAAGGARCQHRAGILESWVRVAVSAQLLELGAEPDEGQGWIEQDQPPHPFGMGEREPEREVPT